MNSDKINELRDYILEQIQDMHPADQKDILEELADDFKIMCEDMQSWQRKESLTAPVIFQIKENTVSRSGMTVGRQNKKAWQKSLKIGRNNLKGIKNESREPRESQETV